MATLAALASTACYTTYSEHTEREYEPPCTDTRSATPGANGQLLFRYNYSEMFCMLFGCSADAPLVEGSSAQIVILSEGDVDTPETVRVTSDDPGVAEFEHNRPAVITVHALAAGDVRMEIRDAATDELFEALALSVKPVAAIKHSLPEYDSQLSLMVGGAERVHVEPWDDADWCMVGIGGLAYAPASGLGDSQLAITEGSLETLTPLLVGGVTEYFVAEALGAGTGAVEVSAPSGAALEIPMSLVEGAAVGTLKLTPAAASAEVGGSCTVQAEAYAADGERIYSPGCSWSLQPAGGAFSLFDSSRDETKVEATAAGQVEVRCAIAGGPSASASISFTAP